jgi:hypothetical protein
MLRRAARRMTALEPGCAAHLRPRVALGLVLVVRTTGLEHRLVNAATARHDANRRARERRNRLLLPRRETQTRAVSALDVADDLRKAARRLGELALVTLQLLDVVDDRTRRHVSQRHHVARHQCGCGTRAAQAKDERQPEGRAPRQPQRTSTRLRRLSALPVCARGRGAASQTLAAAAAHPSCRNR